MAQVTDRGHSVTPAAKQIGISPKSPFDWVKLLGDEPGVSAADAPAINCLKLRRVNEERDILKKATAYFAKDHG